MSFEEFLRANEDNALNLKTRMLTLFKEKNPAHTTHKYLCEEFRSKIVKSDPDAAVTQESSTLSLIPYSFVDDWYDRFMEGNLSLDEKELLPPKQNVFNEYGVQELIVEHADFMTVTNLRRVNKSFEKVCSRAPNHLNRIKMISGHQKICLETFDEKRNGWIQFVYEPQTGNACLRTVDGRKDLILGQDYNGVFVKDFVFLINKLGDKQLEEFVFDFEEVLGIDYYRADYYTGVHNECYRAILEQIQGRIRAKKLTITINEIDIESVGYVRIMMQYLNPAHLETLKFIGVLKQEDRRLLCIDRFEPNELAETEQWRAARHLEWYPSRCLPDNHYLTGFETVKTTSSIPVAHIASFIEAFSRVPPTNKFTMFPENNTSEMMHMELYFSLMDPLGVNGTYKFPIRDTNRNLVITVHDDKIEVTAEDRN